MQHIHLPFGGALWQLSSSPCCPVLRSRHSLSTLPFYSITLWIILGVLMCPCCVQCLIFKVGILGPWNCDPYYAKSLPAIASRLAVGRINEDFSLDLGCTMDFVILQEACETSKALTSFVQYENMVDAFVGPTNPGYCNAAALMGKNWDKSIFSWACINYELDRVQGYPTFARTLPSPTRVLFSVLRFFSLANIAIVSSNEDIWIDTAAKLASALRSQGLPVGIVVSMGNNDTMLEDTLLSIQNAGKIKVIIMCMHSALIGGEQQKSFLMKAYDMGLTKGQYVFIPYDTLLYSLPYTNTTYFPLQNNTKLRKAYDAVLTITIESDLMSFNEAYNMAKRFGELMVSQEPEQVSPLFGTIYNSLYLLAKSMHNARRAGKWFSGSNLASFTRNITFSGFNQNIRMDAQGNGQTDYVILDTDGWGSELYRCFYVKLSLDKVLFAGTYIHFPAGSPPPSDSSCWFDPNAICTGGVEITYVIISFVMALIMVLGSIGLTLFIRRRIQQIQLIKGPNRILLTLEDLTFINPQLSKRKITLEDLCDSKSYIEEKSTGERSRSVNSMATATHETSNVAVYEGDWVWLKKFKEGHFKEVKQSTTKIFTKMKDLRNENVNPFLGFFTDCEMFAIVTEHCSRGSLHDLLRNEDVKLDWMFKSSLLLDLIKGMKYLHHREFPHGRLKSHNCVVDGRFVLKITDYGYSEILETQKAPKETPPPEDLFWTAPELLRDPESPRKGTYKADVYSFAIILQEVVVRGTPYCMLGLSPEEIIRKVKKPPPMCRPTVAPDQAPLECIQLMKQCWSEQPDRRPPFDQIFDQVSNKNISDNTERMCHVNTVNTASRMESTGLPYRIHVNISTVNILRSLNDGYKIEVRGKTELKGKGIEETYWLVGKSNFTKPLPKPPEIKPGDNWQDMMTEEIKSLFRKANRQVDKPKI
uniref:guanylate cyclase n=1 Tax=Cyprinus carpio TaxID=7962 RepID=A0A8C2Q088_CYPCA